MHSSLHSNTVPLRTLTRQLYIGNICTLPCRAPGTAFLLPLLPWRCSRFGAACDGRTRTCTSIRKDLDCPVYLPFYVKSLYCRECLTRYRSLTASCTQLHLPFDIKRILSFHMKRNSHERQVARPPHRAPPAPPSHRPREYEYCMTNFAVSEVTGHEIQTRRCIQSSRFSFQCIFSTIWRVTDSSD